MRKKIKNSFTLIEVAVVLLVVVALAGVVVPLALGYAQRSHGATGAGNIAQLTSNINRFEVENFAMPDGWDSLVDEGDAAYATAFTPTAASTIDVDLVAKLNDAGNTTVFDLDSTDGYSTFGDSVTEETIEGTTVLALFTTPQDVNDSLGASNDPLEAYIGLGIGENLTAIGKTIATAPYDFPEGAEKPEDTYKRFIAVFNVSGEKAKFVGVVAVDGGEVANIQDHINEYYEATE
jgi:Tfp pilus assembly protein PilE